MQSVVALNSLTIICRRPASKMFFDPSYLLAFLLDFSFSSGVLSVTIGLLTVYVPHILEMFRGHMDNKHEILRRHMANKHQLEMLRFHAVHPSIHPRSWDGIRANTEASRRSELESASKLSPVEADISSIDRLMCPIITITVFSVWIIHKIAQFRLGGHLDLAPFEQDMILFIVSYWFGNFFLLGRRD